MRSAFFLALAVLCFAGLYYVVSREGRTAVTEQSRRELPTKPKRDITNRNTAYAAERPRAAREDVFARSRAKNEFRDQFLTAAAKQTDDEPEVEPAANQEDFAQYRSGKWVDSLSGLKMRDDLVAEEKKECDAVRCPPSKEKEVLLFGVVTKTRDAAPEKLERRWDRGSYVEKTPALYYK